MPFGFKRADLQAVAQVKLDDAIALLTASSFSNAYYLAGYAVEIGLKACIARSISAETIPERAFINAIYTHDLKALVGTAGLTQELRDREDADSTFAANWALVAQWRPEIRYETVDQKTAQIMVQGVNDPSSGVFPWIKAYW